jgi:hypothetical protein
MDLRQRLRSPPVRAQYGPTLPQLLGPRIDSLPRIAARLLGAVGVIVVIALVLLALRLRDPTFSSSVAPRFTTSYPRSMTLERAPRGVTLLLRQNSSVGLAASFEIRPLLLPRYSGEISGLLPVIAAKLIRQLAAADPTFVLWSQGRTRINLVPGYAFTFAQKIGGRPYWGRDVLLTPHLSGDRRGLLMSMLTDPALLSSATPPITPDSVGSVGVLFEPLERLRFG